MKNLTLTILIASILCTLFSCSQPQEKAKTWYKGNLHTHSYWSDGDEFPEMIMDWYKSKGYDFAVLSDHNILANIDYWVEIRSEDIYQEAFKKYLAKYDSNWVEYKVDSGVINVKLKTYEEYKPLFEEPGEFLIIQSEEITDRFEKKHVHMNATNIQKLIEPQGGGSVVEVMQNNIDAVQKQREETGVPMIVHINHPNFHYSITLEDMIQIKGERFFEVFNGHPGVHNLGDSIHIGTEKMWDLINIAYSKADKPLLYGLGTDDSHHYHRIDSKWSNAGRGWVMVQADTLTPGSLIDAMENGQFYASSGVTLSDVSLENNVLTVEVEQEPGIEYEISIVGCNVGDEETKVLETIKGTQANFPLTEKTNFVRMKVVSSKLHSNPIETALYEMAWTQPVTYGKE
ncbi:MAG: histidinol-phosphatase [Cyclobacteriaceae bacterium]